MKTRFIILVLFANIVTFGQTNFKSEEVVVTDLVSGTLNMPIKNTTKTNLMILIAGSGPTDRNGNQNGLTNNSLKMLCDALADKGIATFSFDKRIIAQMKLGKIDESKLSFSDMIEDAKAAIALFKLQNKFSRIIVAGHSEGSLVGMVAAHQTADAFISLAGAGRPIDEILEEQIVKQMPSVKTVLREKLNDLKAGNAFDPSSIGPMLAPMFRKSVQPYLISWIKLNPQNEIQKLQMPILIVNGDKDLQVPSSDAEILHKFASTSQLEIIPNMNHIFKTIEGDLLTNQASYTNPLLAISPILVSKIYVFLNDLK